MGQKESKAPAQSVRRARGLSTADSLAQIRSEEERLRQLNVERAALADALQPTLRALQARLEFERLCKVAVRRRHVAEEILQTEESYIESLTVVLDVFGDELKRARVADEAQLRLLFPEIKTLIAVNSSLRDRLAERLKDFRWTTMLGAAFLEAIPYLKAYTAFVTHYPNACALIKRRADEDEQFRAALERAQANPRCRNNDIWSFMIMPVQRVPRYELLLRDLLSVTPPGHCDHDDVERAVSLIKDTAIAINTSKKNAVNAQKLIEIYGILTPPIDDLVQPHRSILCRGLLTDFSQSKHPNGKLYMFFLFNDLLVKAGADVDKQGRHTVKLVVDLAGAAVVSAPDSGRMHHALQLTKAKSGGAAPLSLLLSAKSADGLSKWFGLLTKAIADVAARQQSFAASRTSTSAAVSPRSAASSPRTSASASPAPGSPASPSSAASSSSRHIVTPAALPPSSSSKTVPVHAPSALPPSSKLKHANTVQALPTSMRTKAPY